MKQFVKYVQSLGCLHDSGLLGFFWYPKDTRLEIDVEDIYANVEGTDIYPGLRNAKFSFSCVSKLVVEVDLSEAGLMIYSFDNIIKDSGSCLTNIGFSPYGKIAFEWKNVVVDDHMS